MTWFPSIESMVDVIDFALPLKKAVVQAIAENVNAVPLAYALTTPGRLI